MMDKKATINWLSSVAQRQWPWQKLLMQQDSNSNQMALWEENICSYCDNQLAVHCSLSMLSPQGKTATAL